MNAIGYDLTASAPKHTFPLKAVNPQRLELSAVVTVLTEISGKSVFLTVSACLLCAFENTLWFASFILSCF